MAAFWQLTLYTAANETVFNGYYDSSEAAMVSMLGNMYIITRRGPAVAHRGYLTLMESLLSGGDYHTWLRAHSKELTALNASVRPVRYEIRKITPSPKEPVYDSLRRLAWAANYHAPSTT